MAPKRKAPRQKKAAIDSVAQVAMETASASLKIECRGDGVVVVESGVKKIEQMAALDIAQLNSLNLPLPPPVIKPGERGLGLGSELTRPLHGSALLEELSRMRQEKSVPLVLVAVVFGSRASDHWSLLLRQVPDGPGAGLQDESLRRPQTGHLLRQPVLQGDSGQRSWNEAFGAAVPVPSGSVQFVTQNLQPAPTPSQIRS